MPNMAIEGGANREVDALAASPPDAVIVAVLDALLEESRHVALSSRVALDVQTDSLAHLGIVHTRLACSPQIGSASDGSVARGGALHGDGVTVHEGDVAVGSAGGGEEALEFGVATAGIGFGANEHGATGFVVRGEAHRLGSFGPGAAAAPWVGVCVGPGSVVVRKGDALLADGIRRIGDKTVEAWVDHWSAVTVVLGHGGAASYCEEGQVGLVSELHFG